MSDIQDTWHHDVNSKMFGQPQPLLAEVYMAFLWGWLCLLPEAFLCRHSTSLIPNFLESLLQLLLHSCSFRCHPLRGCWLKLWPCHTLIFCQIPSFPNLSVLVFASDSLETRTKPASNNTHAAIWMLCCPETSSTRLMGPPCLNSDGHKVWGYGWQVHKLFARM